MSIDKLKFEFKRRSKLEFAFIFQEAEDAELFSVKILASCFTFTLYRHESAACHKVKCVYPIC